MGAYLAIVGQLLKLANYIAAGLQKHHDEMNGATAQREETDGKTLDTLRRVGAPGSSGDVEQLWRDNKARFGAGSGEGG